MVLSKRDRLPTAGASRHNWRSLHAFHRHRDLSKHADGCAVNGHRRKTDTFRMPDCSAVGCIASSVSYAASPTLPLEIFGVIVVAGI